MVFHGISIWRCVGILKNQEIVIDLLKILAGRLQDQADLGKIRLRQDEFHVHWTYVGEWKAKLGLAQ